MFMSTDNVSGMVAQLRLPIGTTFSQNKSWISYVVCMRWKQVGKYYLWLLIDEKTNWNSGQADSKRHDGKQKKLVLWWPPLAAWVSSGLNMGHWTPSCEEWYQSRLAEIRAGHAQLHTQLQWRQKLMRVPSPLLLTNDQLAASFLAENGTRIATGALAQQFPKAILSRDPRKNSGDRSYFTLRTQRSESPTPQAEPTKPLPPQSCSVPKVSAETKQTLSPEIQQLTRQYWDTRRTIMSLALRGNAIEQRLRNLHVKDPDIYLTSTGTTSG
jgi:hypothetical protein